MFDKNIYIKRREILKKELKSGLILFLGNEESIRNFNMYTFPFRQNSSFLYYFGLNHPELDAIIDIDNDSEILFGRKITIDDVVWSGPQTDLDEKAKLCGVNNFYEQKELIKFLDKKRTVHFLPAYRLEHFSKLNAYLYISIDDAKKKYSLPLINAVASQRNIKDIVEIKEIENTLNLTADIFTKVIKTSKPNLCANNLLYEVDKILDKNNACISFPPIVTVMPDVIHNFDYNVIFKEGDFLLIDAGFENKESYCSDITRTIPISKKFSQKQKDFYNIVLAAQTEAVKLLKPNVKYIDVYNETSKFIFNGLKEFGLTKGLAEDAVSVGAHALFFPHGLGHLMGLDAHDLEDLGETYVGYDEHTKRSELFGVKFQRFAKELKEGMVITVEPGIYFIKALINEWRKNNLHKDYINYDAIAKFSDVGGIRIEDDYLITKNGARKLGPDIAKTVEEIEALRS